MYLMYLEPFLKVIFPREVNEFPREVNEFPREVNESFILYKYSLRGGIESFIFSLYLNVEQNCVVLF